MKFPVWFAIAVLSLSGQSHANAAEPLQNPPAYREIVNAITVQGSKAIALLINTAPTEQQQNLSPALSLRRKELLSRLEAAIKTEAGNHLGAEFPVFVLDQHTSEYPHELGAKDILFYEINIGFDTNKADEKDTIGILNTSLYRMVHWTGQAGLSRSPYTAEITPRTFLVFSPEADAAMQSMATDLVVFIRSYAPHPLHKKD
ncbi:MAG TPA: hypothetical protein VHP34_09395 [Alphaproteobacteria bacterium]|jgi:hypothetical protein|nr:hypothetical protein [Alphaproteobacteria bacterium]